MRCSAAPVGPVGFGALWSALRRGGTTELLLVAALWPLNLAQQRLRPNSLRNGSGRPRSRGCWPAQNVAVRDLCAVLRGVGADAVSSHTRPDETVLQRSITWMEST